MERFVGKVAVVIGASAGIGAAICQKLVEAGMKVVGLARRVEKIEDLAKSLEPKKGKLYPYKADVSVETDIQEAFNWSLETLGPLHVLVNCAGVVPHSTLVDGETAKWKTVLDTNVLGLTIATREAIKIMRENQIDGHIIHLNSVMGHLPSYIPGMHIYGASKYAVTNLTNTLRRELNHFKLNIKVTSVSPGLVDTTILDDIALTDRTVEAGVKAAPKLQPKDVADGIFYVLGTPPHVQVHELTIKPMGEQI